MDLGHVIMTERDWRDIALGMAEAGVAKSGKRLSGLLAYFIYVVSDGREDEVTAMFRRLRDAFETKLHQTHGPLIVFDRIFALLEAGEKEVKDRSRSKKLKSKVTTQNELTELVRRPVGKEHFVDALVKSFCGIVAELQSLLSSLPDGPISVKTIKCRISRCEEGLDEIQSDINHYGWNFSSPVQLGDLRAEHEFLHVKMESKVDQLWRFATVG